MHADGTDEDYIIKAIAEGVKVLGFSDHAPYLYPNGYVSNYKMPPENAPQYISALLLLREKYRDKIDIRIGFEAEYYPLLWESTLEFWKKLGSVEYLILGQHFTREEYPYELSVHAFSGIKEASHLKEYVSTVTEGIKTKKFTYIAHPDVANYMGTDLDLYREQMRHLVLAAKEYDTPLELNLLGIAFERNYPAPMFWEVASELSPRVILGCDAHQPRRVADKDEILRALRFADKYKLNVVDDVELINPFE